jgi:hypothetical protein
LVQSTKLVERHHLHRRQVAPVERHARGERRGEQVRQRDDDLVRLALGALHVEESLGAGPAGLVDHHHRLLHEIVLGDDGLHCARHLVGPTTGARRDDELDGLGRLPGLRLHGGSRADSERRSAQND